jgi:hypothetical protein
LTKLTVVVIGLSRDRARGIEERCGAAVKLKLAPERRLGSMPGSARSGWSSWPRRSFCGLGNGRVAALLFILVVFRKVLVVVAGTL